ncbi:hypothetical protein [Lactococcus phage P1046]|uniref:Uncharacterized protein n=1 Tax=Lactococcus phage P1046 TaxID=2662294 RepID=A0A649V1Q0_9CAUD|nr:hypothetical protein [Lactococcus phage P1046]
MQSKLNAAQVTNADLGQAIQDASDTRAQADAAVEATK